MTVRVGLLGAGRIGTVHARAISGNPQAKLVAVADAVPEAAQAIAGAYGCVVRTIDEIAAAKDIDAVLICTPSDTHPDLIEQFAKAGKAIFCEKPVDLNLARVRDCLAVVRDTGAMLMVGFNRRFDPHFRAVRAEIDAGNIGEVEMVTITSRDPGVPSADYIARSGGIFHDMTIHDLDMARFLLGEDVATVMASAPVLADPAAGDSDGVNVMLTTVSGKQCVISTSRRAVYGYDQHVEVHGSAGSLSAENQRESFAELEKAERGGKLPFHDFFVMRYAAAYAAEIAAFVDIVARGGVPSPSGEDGLAALRLAEAVILSLAEGRRVAVAEVAG